MYRVPFNGVMIECDTDQEARTLVAGTSGRPGKQPSKKAGAGAAGYWDRVKKIRDAKNISTAAARKLVAKQG